MFLVSDHHPVTLWLKDGNFFSYRNYLCIWTIPYFGIYQGQKYEDQNQGTTLS